MDQRNGNGMGGRTRGQGAEWSKIIQDPLRNGRLGIQNFKKTRGLQAESTDKQFTLLLVELFTLKTHLVPLSLSQSVLINSDT